MSGYYEVSNGLPILATKCTFSV